MTHVSISESAHALILLEDQLEKALKSERRWDREVRDAARHRQAAREHAAACREAIRTLIERIAQ